MTNLAQGNFGAMNVLSRIGVEATALLETYRIYGCRIWMLYKDVCREDIANTQAVLRATQLGIVSEQQLNTAIDNRGAVLDVPATVQQVQGK